MLAGRRHGRMIRPNQLLQRVSPEIWQKLKTLAA